MVLAAIGVWTGNLLVLLGLWLLYRLVRAQPDLPRIRHTKTGQPIPALHNPAHVDLFFNFSTGQKQIRDPLQEVLSRREHGSAFLLWQGPRPLVVISDPEDARRVLHDKGEHFSGSSLIGKGSVLYRMMGKSLVSLSGTEWKSQRRAMEPAFKYKKMRSLVPMFARCTRKLIDRWETQLDQPIKVEEGITRVTLDAIGMGGFGYDFGAVEGSKEMGENLKHYYSIVGAVFRPSAARLFPFLSSQSTSDNAAIESSIHDFQAFLNLMVANHRERKHSAEEEDLDVLDHIITMNQEGLLSDEEIRHNLFLFFMAGHDTSSSALTAALYFMSKYPEMQEKAHNEVASVLGDRDNIDYSDLSKLEYLSMFLRETLRMRPPVVAPGSASRIVIADSVVVGGYAIPKGVTVSPCIASLNYDERTWRDPYTFNPERFADKDAPKDVWSFSAGPRVCLGKKFAMTEMLTVLAVLLQKFEFKLISEDYRWQFRPYGLTLRPLDGLPLRLQRRQIARTSGNRS